MIRPPSCGMMYFQTFLKLYSAFPENASLIVDSLCGPHGCDWTAGRLPPSAALPIRQSPTAFRSEYCGASCIAVSKAGRGRAIPSPRTGACFVQSKSGWGLCALSSPPLPRPAGPPAARPSDPPWWGCPAAPRGWTGAPPCPQSSCARRGRCRSCRCGFRRDR